MNMMVGTLLSNRYRIDAQLGEGGMGVVYKAHDTLLDRPVAIKTLSPHLLGDEGLKRLLREAQAAAKLTHPNIVATYDVIDDGDSRLIAMEYVEGRTLRELIPLPWTDAVEIATQVCQALDFAHARGVVHRDIKPENIVVTPQGIAKVMDFGLARSEGRSRLTQTGMLVGTVAYMAPEQALQGTADARSDLYSLGCVLYEAITGHAPFEADDPIAVITQHINIPPVAPRFHASAVPPALEGVILKLLAKDPQARYKSARDTGVVLEGIRGTVAAQPAAEAKVTGPELVQAVRRGTLIGRDEELATLKRILDDAASGEGRLVLISGQAGVGKTRLVEALITYAHLRGVRVLSAKCYEGGTPYEPVVRMLREYLQISPADEVRAALGDYAPDLAPLVPEVKQKLGGLPESIPLPPEQERARLFESVARLFTTLSKSDPLLLFVDDLHLGDPATLALIRYFAPAVASERLLLMSAYQSEEADRTPGLSELLRQFRRERYTSSIELRPLGQAQVNELIKAMANHPTAPTRFANRIFEVTEGNPYFIEEVINTLFEQGTLNIKDGQWSTDFDEGGRYAEMPVSATIRTTIETRLDRLSEPCRQALTQAAVLGRQFQLDLLARVTNTAEDQLVDLLEEALRARLLREVRVAGEDRYEFAQSMVREVIYEGISRHRRRRMHLRAAEALEQMYVTRDERAGEIADHFLEAGEEQRAVPYLVKAGEHAEAVFAHEEAIGRLETARELLEDAGKTDEVADLLQRLGPPYFYAGQPQKAIDYYQRALKQYEAKGLSAKAAHLRRKIGAVYSWTFDFAAAIPMLEQALKDIEGEISQDGLTLYHDLAHAYTFSGEPERGIEWAQKALELATAAGDTDVEANAHIEMGIAHAWLWQLDEASAHYREAIRQAEKSRSFLGRHAVRRATNNLGTLESGRGNHKSAADMYRRALSIAEEIRDPTWIAMHLENLGDAFRWLGDWKAARETFNRVLALGERAGHRLRTASGDLHFLNEEWEAVREVLEAELSDAERRRDEQAIRGTLQGLAATSILLDQYSQAEHYARRAVEVTRGRPLAQIVLAESLARQGNSDEAKSLCDRAEERLRQIQASGQMARLHHIRGLIAGAAGQQEEAARHLQEAVRVYEEFPNPFGQARVFEDLGHLYGDRDLDRAVDAFTNALAIYERLGAKKSMQRMNETIEHLRTGSAQ